MGLLMPIIPKGKKVMKAKAFSLIELMIVVAIIAFLAMVSIPTFKRFLHKCKRSEAYMNLHAIYAAQKAYWAEHGKYSDVLSGENSIGWKPEGSIYYTYGFSGGSEGKNYFVGSFGTPALALSDAKATDNSFIVVAAGDIDGDGSPDVLTIDENNNIVIVKDDLAD